MLAHADPADRSDKELFDALLEYAKAPGKYHVAQRQPPLLFASIREILQVAAGRDPDTGLVTDQEKASLRRAARFFTRTALFYPGADHYALLGLDRNFDAAELKERYRLLMRLTHPDFHDASSGAWPSDAAVRVNLANDVLSSAVQRREYDARLPATANVPSPSVKVERRRINHPVRTPSRGVSRFRLKQVAIISSVAGAGVVLLSLFGGGQDAVRLVQRVKPQAIETNVAAVPEPLAASVPAPPPAPLRMVAPTPPTYVPAPAPVPASVPVPVLKRAPPSPLPAPLPVPVSIRFARTEPPPAAPSLPAPTEAAPIAVTAAVTVAPIAPITVAKPLPAPPPPLPRPVPVAGVSLAEAQPLLSMLLQQLESGRGDRLINLLDRDARNKPGAQALSRQYDGLVDGMQPVRLSHVEFKAEPADGRLLVTGNIRLQIGEQTIGSLGKKMVLHAEFASRDGTVVLTGLTGGTGN